METGYYVIKHLGHLLPARWDGKYWHHEHGTSFEHPEHDNVCKDDSGTPVVIALSCPTGCTCTQNQDGSTTVNCNPHQ